MRTLKNNEARKIDLAIFILKIKIKTLLCDAVTLN